jgi:16S rRNA (uracil1498-N3)-methyltransferase
MPAQTRNAPRLFVTAPLEEAAQFDCTPDQVNYLVNVLRLRTGDAVLVFNGRDGEWHTDIVDVGKRRCSLACRAQVRAQASPPDIHYLFAPLKHARLDYMVQKATEMGAARLQPVTTRRTVAARVKEARMHANAVEAAEQCRVLWVPEIGEVRPLGDVLREWDGGRRLIFCDEAAEVASPLEVLSRQAPGPLAVLIGPEGGFDAEERASLLAKPFTVPISLGPRIMRADTAAVAALALVNAVLGDWS